MINQRRNSNDALPFSDQHRYKQRHKQPTNDRQRLINKETLTTNFPIASVLRSTTNWMRQPRQIQLLCHFSCYLTKIIIGHYWSLSAWIVNAADASNTTSVLCRRTQTVSLIIQTYSGIKQLLCHVSRSFLLPHQNHYWSYSNKIDYSALCHLLFNLHQFMHLAIRKV